MPPVRMAISCSISLRRSPKPGALTATHVQRAAQAVDDQGGQSLALDILCDDNQLAAALHDTFQQGQQILDYADLLIGDEDIGVVHNGFHLVRVGDHVGRDITAIKHHAFHDFAVGLSGLGLLPR